MVFRIAHNFHAAATGHHDVAFRNSFRSVISPLRVDIRPDQANQLAYIGLIKDEDRVHVLQRRQDLCALAFRDARTPVALESAHTGVRIHRDHNSSAELFCAAKVADMPDVQNVKATVGKGDCFAGRLPRAHTLAKLLQGNQLVLRAGQGQPSITARSNSSRVTVAVPRFITTIPPA